MKLPVAAMAAMATIHTLTQSVIAFTPVSPAFLRPSSLSTPSTTQLYEVIRGTTEQTDVLDEGLGGVRLAQESAILITGTAEKASTAEANTDVVGRALLRYKKMTELSDDDRKKLLESHNMELVCKGYGQEVYHDPGSGTEKRIELAPVEAAKRALSSIVSDVGAEAVVGDAKSLTFNILGGDDLMFEEVTQSVQMMVDGLEGISNDCELVFRSLCHASFPLEFAAVTVIATKKGGKKDEEEDVVVVKASGADTASGAAARSVKEGNLYWYQDKWWTVLDEDINPAIA